MDRRQQNDNDILTNSKSRFSQEERARMSRENLRDSYSNSANERTKRRPVNKTMSALPRTQQAEHTRDRKSTARNADIYSAERKNKNRTSSASKREEGSLNDRMKKSSEARRKNNRIKNNTFFAILVIVVVSLCTLAAALLLRVNTIEVTGSERYSDKTILDTAKLDTSDSMLLLNLSYLEQKLEESLPYIETAELKREWPDKIVVNITDAVPSLAVDTGEGYILMNNSCKVLDTDSVILPAQAALIRGIIISEAEPGKTAVFDSAVSIEEFAKLTHAFENLGLEGVSEYDLSSVSNVVLTIDHRIQVKLGTLAGADEKLGFGKYIIEKTIEENPDGVFVINISADGKAYVRDMYDNNVNFDEPTTAEEMTSDENTSVQEEELTEDVTTPETTEEMQSSFG